MVLRIFEFMKDEVRGREGKYHNEDGNNNNNNNNMIIQRKR
jgi:hypothetical protein